MTPIGCTEKEIDTNASMKKKIKDHDERTKKGERDNR